MTKLLGVAIVLVFFASAMFPIDSGNITGKQADFFLTFGTSPIGGSAQMAVDNYFEVMLKVACRAPVVSYGHPELERAQELAEGLGFDAPIGYKRFRYGRTCAGTE